MTRRKPSKPRAVVIDDGFNIPALGLPANRDVTIEDASRHNEKRGRRLDVFSLFYERKAIEEAHYLAVRRLEADIHLAAGVAGTSEAREFVQGGGCQERITQRMLDAHGRVVDLTGMMGRDVSELLLVLLSPLQQGAILTRWRGHVLRLTGVSSDEGQADRIRWIAATAAAAYASLDYGEPARRTA